MQESFWFSKFSTRSGARKRDFQWRKFRKETVEKGIVETEEQKENCGKRTVETVVKLEVYLNLPDGKLYKWKYRNESVGNKL